MSPLGVFRYRPFGEKATWQTEPEWPSSVLRQDPVAASHSRTVSSSDADATSWPSGEKATASTELEWPSSVLRQESQLSSIFDSLLTHPGMWPVNVFRIILISGVKIRAEEQTCKGAFCNRNWNRSVNRLASRRKLELALLSDCIIGKYSNKIK